MNTTTQDKAKICELTEQWINLWSPQDKTQFLKLAR